MVVSKLVSEPTCSGFESQHPQFFSGGKIVDDVAEVNKGGCLKESGLWLENVDQTHLVLASG